MDFGAGILVKKFKRSSSFMDTNLEDIKEEFLCELIEEAIEQNNTEAVRFLLRRGIPAYGRGIKDDHVSLVNKAILQGNIEMLKAFMNTGEVRVDGKYNDIGHRFTMLISAAFEGNLEIVRYLIKMGAKLDPDYNQKDSRGELDWDGILITPLIAALANKKYGIVEYLIQCGANLDISLIEVADSESDMIKSPLRIAEFLLEKGASVKSVDHLRSTILHRAIQNENIDLVKLLLKYKTDPSIKDYDGESALSFAKKHFKDENHEIIKLLQ
jgi:ankyrin repeat protein